MNNHPSFIQESNSIEGYNYFLSSYDEPIDDPKVYDHVLAYDAITKLVGKVLTLEDVLHVHKVLMGRLLPEEHQGLRSIRVQVGGRECLKPEFIGFALNEWLSSFNERKENDLTIHYEFERIHPFVDGNGRSGRLFWALDRMNRDMSVYPILMNYESQDFFVARSLYYSAIKQHCFDKTGV